MAAMYRKDLPGSELKNPFRPRCPPARRVPGNVPYLVDNLWEWRRPAGFPSRRQAVFASPTPELATEAGGTPGGRIFRVEIRDENSRICQIRDWDAREHAEVKLLPKLLNEVLGSAWINGQMEDKQEIAALWAPCLLAEEVEDLFSSGNLASLRSVMCDAILFWDEAHLISPSQAQPFPEGEIFFEASEWHLLNDASQG
jgi:hypothetical protein